MGGEPLCYSEAVVLHVRKTDPEMPRDRAKVMIELRLELIFGSQCNRTSKSKGHDVRAL